MKRLLSLLFTVIAFTAANADNFIPILGAFLSDAATFSAEDMKRHIDYPYTGEISYDGPNRKIVLNNFVLTDTLKTDFIDITVKYPEGFTIELHGTNYIKGSSATHVIQSKSNMHLIADNDASFTAEGGGIENNGFIKLENSTSIIFEGGSYTLSPTNSVSTYPVLFSVNSYIPDSIACDPASVSLSNIPPASLVFRNCNAHFTGKNAAFAACFGYFGMAGCEVTYPDNFFVYVSGVASSPELIVESMIAIDATNFPNGNFRNIIAQYDTDGDGYLNKAELTSIASVTSLNVSSKSINNLKGIEYFTGLQYLYCSNNQLTALDVSKNRNLKLLECQNNFITSLDVSGMQSLFRLFCNNNRLTELKIDDTPALCQFYIYRNKLSYHQMIKVVDALPTVTNDATWFYVYDNTNLTEGNMFYAPLVQYAIEKGWTPMYYDGTNWLPFEGDTNYPLHVGGVQVCEANFANITGDNITGSVSFDPYNLVLTLNNATINGSNAIHVGSKLPGLTIRLIGNNTINCPSNSNMAINWGNCDESRLTGPGSLSINNGWIWLTSGYNNGDHRLTIDSCTVTLTHGGISYDEWDESLTINHASVHLLNGYVSVGYYDLQLVDCYISKPEGGHVSGGSICAAGSNSYFEGEIEVLPNPDVAAGDANNDGTIDVLDVTSIINYILGKNPSPFNPANANVNGDDVIDVLDVTLIINMILGNV